MTAKRHEKVQSKLGLLKIKSNKTYSSQSSVSEKIKYGCKKYQTNMF